MQKRILVPMDGSPLSDRIVAQVRRLLVRQDAEVVLLTVVDPTASKDDRLELDERVQRAKDHLNGVRDALVDQGAVVTVEVATGEPVATIVERARRIGAELVCMATHGRTGLSRWVRGSVAEAVVRSSTVPVFLANPNALDAAGGELRIGRILVPLDGSDVSVGVLPSVEAIARLYDAEVILLRVEWTVPMATYPAEVATLRPPREVEALLEPHRRRLEAAGLRVRSIAAYGPEASEILDAADREQVDLVAMSTHGRSGVSRWVFGSVAEQVIRHCGRPLLVRRVEPVEAPATHSPAAAIRIPDAAPVDLPHPPRVLGTQQIVGARVKDRIGGDLGRIEEVVVDLASGRVTYAVLAFGGVLGLGQKLFPVPWGQLHWRPGEACFVLVHKEHVRPDLDQRAPTVQPDEWRQDRQRVIDRMAPAVHSFYGWHT